MAASIWAMIWAVLKCCWSIAPDGQAATQVHALHSCNVALACSSSLSIAPDRASSRQTSHPQTSRVYRGCNWLNFPSPLTIGMAALAAAKMPGLQHQECALFGPWDTQARYTHQLRYQQVYRFRVSFRMRKPSALLEDRWSVWVLRFLLVVSVYG